LSLKKVVTSSQIGVFIDSNLRQLLSLLPYLHSRFFSKRKFPTENYFVFFLYGGYGDAILTLDLVNKLSGLGKVLLYVDSRLENLAFLFPKNSTVIIYNKRKFIRNIAKLRKGINKNSILVQTSPIIEIYILKLLLKIPYAIGILSDFKYIRAIGFLLQPTIVHSNNRTLLFEEIYKKIMEISSPPVICEQHKNLNTIFDYCGTQNKYFILSAMKTNEWQMGRMPELEYRQLSELLIQKYGLNAIYVGDESEYLKVDSIIRDSKFSKYIFNMAGKTTIEELSILIKGSEFVIGNDNGISHLAAYLRAKVMVLFMFSSPNIYAWKNRSSYKYIFNPIEKCMPCVGLPSAPKDNYPVRCKNNLACNYSITHGDVVKELKRVGWIEDSSLRGDDIFL